MRKVSVLLQQQKGEHIGHSKNKKEVPSRRSGQAALLTQNGKTTNRESTKNI